MSLTSYRTAPPRVTTFVGKPGIHLACAPSCMGQHACALLHRSRCLGLVAAPDKPCPPDLRRVHVLARGHCVPKGPFASGQKQSLRTGCPAGQFGNGATAPTVPDRAAGPTAPPLYQLSGGCEPSLPLSYLAFARWKTHRARGRPSRTCAEPLFSPLDRGPAKPA
jgi:hypothetical protein